MVFLFDVVADDEIIRRSWDDNVIAPSIRQSAVGCIDVAAALVDKNHFIRSAVSIDFRLLLARANPIRNQS